MMNWKPNSSLNNLKMRAALISSVREFFRERNVLEVETPLLCSHTVTDPHIESFNVPYPKKTGTFRYLQTSPEYAMKRLLAAGSGCIYQICKAFRYEEQGSIHNPEFTLLEWYRVGYTHHELMDEVSSLLKYLLKTEDAERISYKNLFLKELSINPLTCDIAELSHCVKQHKKEFPRGMDVTDKDAWLQFLMSELLEPTLQSPTFVYDYPPSQGALAKIRAEEEPVAERFELYYKGIELANGFHELSDAKEQLRRFETDNLYRKKHLLEILTPDELLLNALNSGIPPCAGVALGLDRLIMLALGEKTLRDIMAFAFDRV